jgi:hypothetical protein
MNTKIEQEHGLITLAATSNSASRLLSEENSPATLSPRPTTQAPGGNVTQLYHLKRQKTSKCCKVYNGINVSNRICVHKGIG